MISIIIPVYNVECYLKKCIESITTQMNAECEIILVDDGSSDGSGKICDLYATRYSNVRVIHQKNSGVSMARNRGLQEAKGEYIWFVDSDDWLVSGAIEQILHYIEKYAPDVVVFGMSYVEKDKVTYEFKLEEKLCIGQEQSRQYIVELYRVGLIASPVNKVYRKSILKNIWFEDQVKYGEDLRFNMRVFWGVERIINTECIFYCYNQHENSLSTNIDTKQVDDMLLLYDKSNEFFDKMGYDAEIKETLINRHYFEYLYPYHVRKIVSSRLLSIKQKKEAVERILNENYLLYLGERARKSLYKRVMLSRKFWIIVCYCIALNICDKRKGI